MFSSSSRINFQNTVEGTWGQFITPAGEVHFLLTKARLGKGGIDNERRLTSQLRPVREVLDSEKLNFNQLLQRDLDDHRVATQLIPYLLRSDKGGPSFFPPIMTILLPFDSEEPKSIFPKTDFSDVVEDEQLKGLHWHEKRASNAYRIRRLADPDGKINSIKLGQVSWNDEAAKLVVLDGQHRAMALIAIDRTLNANWDKNSGTRFRHFYEHRIQEILNSAKQKNQEIDLSKIEIPVTVCWFPDHTQSSKNPHGAARKLFIDVNKEARKPSEARLVLLSDAELINIFTRCLLNRLREDNPPLPLYAIEYDNPNDDSNRPVRWSAMADLALLKKAIQFTAFCPAKYRQNMKQRFGGRLASSDMDSRMREELRLGDVLPATIEEDDIERDGIGNDIFPPSQLDVICSQFMGGWGISILGIFGQLKPYKAHAVALKKLRESWLTDDAKSSLANDAIFVGVGMYWTLRDSDRHYTQQKERMRREHSEIPPQPDIVKAWEIIEKKNDEFQVLRSNVYCGKSSPDAIKDTNAAFDMMNTHACQLGICLMMSTLADILDAKMEALVSLTTEVIGALNAALEHPITQSRSRIFFLDRNQKNSINRIPRLDPSLSIYFRYFWLELLCTPQAMERLQTQRLVNESRRLLNDCRSSYLEFLIGEQVKSLKRSNPAWKEAQLKEESEKIEVRELRKALDFWDFASKESFDEWFSTNQQAAPTSSEAVETSVENTDDDLPENGEVNESIDDIINSANDDD